MGWSQFAFTGSITVGAGAYFLFHYDTPQFKHHREFFYLIRPSMMFAGESRL
jgi:hypothetical protein